MRKRLSIFTHGGIGTGERSQGFPPITQIVNRLSGEFDISVYSLATFNENFRPETFKAFSPPSWLRLSSLRWVWLIGTFFRQNLSKGQHVLCSFWGYPSGFVIVALGALLNKKTVVILLGAESANAPEINYGHLRKPLTRKMILWTCRSCTELVAVARYQLKNLERYGINRKATIIPWGSDTTIFFPVPKEKALPLRILHVGNLTEVKDQETLLRAFQIISSRMPATLRMVGPDFLNGKIQHLAKQLGLQPIVEFIGLVPHHEIVQHYQWAHVFMLTSLSEGQNSSLGEAMTSGLLPVSTAVGAMYEFRDIGVVADPRDFTSLGNQLVDLYFDPPEWEKRRLKALRLATEHDLNWTVSELKKILND
jgi:glycosyltransferase involved in cell wall biosynthesis